MCMYVCMYVYTYTETRKSTIKNPLISKVIEVVILGHDVDFHYIHILFVDPAWRLYSEISDRGFLVQTEWVQRAEVYAKNKGPIFHYTDRTSEANKMFILWLWQQRSAVVCLTFITLRLLASSFSLATFCTNKVVCQLFLLLPMGNSPFLCTNQTSSNACGKGFIIHLGK